MDARQQPATAERFARAALDGGAGFDARIVLAEALQWAGRGDDAESELLAAVDAATTSEQVVRAHDLRADVLFWQQRMADAEDALARAEAVAVTSADRHRIAVRRALFAVGDGDLGYATALADEALADPSIAIRVRQDAAFVVLSCAPLCGRSAWAIDIGDEAVAAVAADGVHLPECPKSRTIACWWAWRFGEVEASVEAAAAAGRSEVDPWRWPLGLVALSTGRIARARQVFADVARQFELVQPETFGDWRSQFWSTLSEAAALLDAELAAPRLEQLEPFIDGPQGPLYAAHARGLADGDASAVRRAAGGFEDVGAVLLAAEAYAQLAKLLHDQGRAVAATGAQLAARRLADQCESANTPALSLASGLDLTERELEIAQLAVHGLSDREIAEQLVISPRTVNTHLHRCYTKLGIDGRADLHDLIG